MGSFIPILTQPNKFTCGACGKPSQIGVSRFDGGRRVGYFCPTCAENNGCFNVLRCRPAKSFLPVNLRINAWPVLALCLTATGTVAVMSILSWLAWIALRTILPHV